MGHFAGNARLRLFAAIGVSAAAILGVCAYTDIAVAAKSTSKPPASAEEAQKQAEQKAKEDARKSYDQGLKSYANGRYQPAIDQLSAALRVGGFTSPQMAKALYTRGLAYKKLKKPGLAISDLTSALWLKNGLDEADRQTATAERADAYRLAGLGDGVNAPERVVVADPNAKPATLPATAAPAAAAVLPVPAPGATAAAPAAQPVVQADGITRQSPESEIARDAANARRLAAQPVEGNGFQSAAMGSLVNAPKSPGDTAVPTAEPAPAVAPSSGGATGGSSITGFFSNIFGGGSQNASASAGDGSGGVTTASTGSDTATSPQVSNWSSSVSTNDGTGVPPPKAAAKPAPIKVAAAAKPARNVGKGKYKIHIAAVRSREEAEALAKKLEANEGKVLKDRVPVVDEAVIGSMGTFYRVRVGSYATAAEPRGVCNSLRSSGFDCLVVTN